LEYVLGVSFIDIGADTFSSYFVVNGKLVTNSRTSSLESLVLGLVQRPVYTGLSKASYFVS